jgi:hypothetical protein
VYARPFNSAGRPPPQAEQTNPSGQRRANTNAAQVASSGKVAWNSVSDRARAPKAPPRLSHVALATPHTTYRVTRDNAIKPRAGRFATRSLRKVRRCLAVSSLGEYRLHLDRFQR